MGQAAGVKTLCPCQRFFERAAVGALVAHRPDDDAGTVLVTLHAAAGAVYGASVNSGLSAMGLFQFSTWLGQLSLPSQ